MNELAKNDTRMVQAKGGEQVRFNIMKHSEYRTFKRVWNAVTCVSLEKEMRIFLGSEPRSKCDVSRLERGEIRRAFSIYRKENDVDFTIDVTDNNTRLYPIDKTVAFIESFILDLRQNPIL